MKQVIRKGLKDIIVDEVPDPVLLPHHVLVRQVGDSMTVNAHFDGKVIVPDEPLDLRPNQALIAEIELIEGETEESALAWIAANEVDSDALPTDLAREHDHYLYGRLKKDTRG